MAFNSAVKSYGSYQVPSEATAEFNRTRHLISDNCTKISRNNGQLSKMVSQLGGLTDDMETRDKLHKLQHQTNLLARQTTTHLQTLTSLNLSPIEMKQNRVVVDELSGRLSSVLRDFQAIQRSQVTEQKKFLSRERTSKQQPPPEQLISTEDDELNSSQIFQDQDTQAQVFSDKDLQLMQQQERQIQQLETDISDINEVFRDLGVLIHNQSSVVDSIEANTESASDEVARGTEELRKARVYREKIRRRKTICMVVATVAGALLLVIIIVSASNS